jgi:periplasmic divalent cation tolerance protein
VSPYPADPVRAVGPARLVVSTYPSREAALSAVETVVTRRLAACGNVVAVESRYWWKGCTEAQSEALVLFKTVPKKVGALFAFLGRTHPYDVPEIVELDVPRIEPRYLAYLSETLGVPAPMRGGRRRATRRAAPRARGARAPARTRAPRRRRSTRTGTPG